MNFIELNRTFHELSEHAGKSDDVDLSQVFHIKSNLTWNDVLKIPRTVILSEAGSGKTQEIRRVAERLREEGKAAFFLRLELIPDDFDIAFEVGTYEQFKAWIASGETGWMLLDSVDDLCEGQDYRAVPKWTGVDLRMPEALLPSNQSQNNPTPKIAETARKAQAQIQTKQRSYIECVSWLESIMRVSPEIRTEAKRRLWAQAQSKWPKKFGFRAFEAAWTEAVAKAEAPVWSTAGRPRKSTRP